MPCAADAAVGLQLANAPRQLVGCAPKFAGDNRHRLARMLPDHIVQTIGQLGNLRWRAALTGLSSNTDIRVIPCANALTGIFMHSLTA